MTIFPRIPFSLRCFKQCRRRGFLEGHSLSPKGSIKPAAIQFGEGSQKKQNNGWHFDRAELASSALRSKARATLTWIPDLPTKKGQRRSNIIHFSYFFPILYMADNVGHLQCEGKFLYFLTICSFPPSLSLLCLLSLSIHMPAPCCPASCCSASMHLVEARRKAAGMMKAPDFPRRDMAVSFSIGVMTKTHRDCTNYKALCSISISYTIHIARRFFFCKKMLRPFLHKEFLDFEKSTPPYSSFPKGAFFPLVRDAV